MVIENAQDNKSDKPKPLQSVPVIEKPTSSAQPNYGDTRVSASKSAVAKLEEN